MYLSILICLAKTSNRDRDSVFLFRHDKLQRNWIQHMMRTSVFSLERKSVCMWVLRPKEPQGKINSKMETVVHLQTLNQCISSLPPFLSRNHSHILLCYFLNFAVAKRRPAESRAIIPRSPLKQTAFRQVLQLVTVEATLGFQLINRRKI